MNFGKRTKMILWIIVTPLVLLGLFAVTVEIIQAAGGQGKLARFICEKIRSGRVVFYDAGDYSGGAGFERIRQRCDTGR